MSNWHKDNKAYLAAYRRRYNATHREAHHAANMRWSRKNQEREIYWGMIQRCLNPNNTSYRFYGALGIKVLYKDFDEFLADVGKRPSKLYSVDRIDVYSHYQPGNCRWATAKQQANNRRFYE